MSRSSAFCANAPHLLRWILGHLRSHLQATLCQFLTTVLLHPHEEMRTNATSSSGLFSNGMCVFSDSEQLAIAIEHELGLSKYFIGNKLSQIRAGSLNSEQTLKEDHIFIIFIFCVTISKRSVRQNIEIIWFRCYWMQISLALSKISWTDVRSSLCTLVSPWDLLWHKYVWDFHVLWTDIGQTGISTLYLQPTNASKAKILGEKTPYTETEFSQTFGGFHKRK